MIRRVLLLIIGLLVGLPLSATAESFDRVDIAPTKTSIYIGSVSMTMPTFVRNGSSYSAPYTAKVFPYFFYSERGTLTVDVSDAQLQALQHGHPIDFTGRAVTDHGAQRRVTAVATPTDGRNGALKVRVYVSKRISLVFHTTYRFVD